MKVWTAKRVRFAVAIGCANCHGSTMKKYYYVGAVRIGMMAGTTVSYLLADHVFAQAQTRARPPSPPTAAELFPPSCVIDRGAKPATPPGQPPPHSGSPGSANRASSGCIFTTPAGMTVRWDASPRRTPSFPARAIRWRGTGSATSKTTR